MVKKSVCVLHGNYANVAWSKKYEKEIKYLKSITEVNNIEI